MATTDKVKNTAQRAKGKVKEEAGVARAGRHEWMSVRSTA